MPIRPRKMEKEVLKAGFKFIPGEGKGGSEDINIRMVAQRKFHSIKAN